MPAQAAAPQPPRSNALLALGIAGASISTLSLFLGARLGAIPWLAGSAVVLAVEIRRRTFGAASRALAASFRAIAFGQLADADQLLAEAERQPFSWSRRIARVQRAIVALRRGDPKAARAHLDAAIALPLGRYARDNAYYQIEAAHALRAFACASLGDHEAALRDVAVVRRRQSPSAEALARASLAEAIVLQRTGERDRLRVHLERDKGLLLESCHPRERAIVRAYQRMVRVASSSAYRVSAPREPDAEPHEEPPLVDWVAKVVPAAAPFVRAPRPAAASNAPPVAPLPETERDATVKVLASRSETAAAVGRKSGRARIVAGASLAAAAVTGLFGFILFSAMSMPELPPPPALGTPVEDAPIHPLPFLVTALVVATITLGVVGYRASRRLRHASREELGRLAMARAAIGRGELDAASAAVTPLVEREHDLLAAHAHAVLAAVAERRADAVAMLAAASWGLGRLARASGPIAASLYPELLAQRALALTLLDRRDEAAAELVQLAHLAHPSRDRDLFRVRLVDLARQGRLDEAARWADQNAHDLPLGVRDELLADLVRAIAAPEAAGLGEIARLRDELRTEPEHRRWIELAAPDVLTAFRAATEGEDTEGPALRIASQESPSSPHDAETEALAEAEADRALAPPLRR